MVTTVFYSDSRGQRIGYAILGGSPAPQIEGGSTFWRGGVPYRLLAENGAAVITWLRHGHLCVVSGHGVSSATLLKLASWSDATVSWSASADDRAPVVDAAVEQGGMGCSVTRIECNPCWKVREAAVSI